MNQIQLTIKTPSNPYSESSTPEASVTLLIFGDPTLEHVALILLDAIGFDADHLFGFHENLKNPVPSPAKRSFSLMADQFPDDCPNEEGVLDTPATALLKPGKTVLFHFDYGDDWRFLLTCDSLAKAEKGAKQGRRILSRNGDFPQQYSDYEEE